MGIYTLEELRKLPNCPKFLKDKNISVKNEKFSFHNNIVTMIEGTIENCNWGNSTFDTCKGDFRNGKFLKGVFADGTFFNSEFIGGYFENGFFNNSVFKEGYWNRGTVLASEFVGGFYRFNRMFYSLDGKILHDNQISTVEELESHIMNLISNSVTNAILQKNLNLLYELKLISQAIPMKYIPNANYTYLL